MQLVRMLRRRTDDEKLAAAAAEAFAAEFLNAGLQDVGQQEPRDTSVVFCSFSSPLERGKKGSIHIETLGYLKILHDAGVVCTSINLSAGAVGVAARKLCDSQHLSPACERQLQAAAAADGAAAAPIWSKSEMEWVTSITLRQGGSLARRLQESRRVVLVFDGYELRYGLPLEAFRDAAVAALSESGVDLDPPRAICVVRAMADTSRVTTAHAAALQSAAAVWDRPSLRWQLCALWRPGSYPEIASGALPIYCRQLERQRPRARRRCRWWRSLHLCGLGRWGRRQPLCPEGSRRPLTGLLVSLRCAGESSETAIASRLVHRRAGSFGIHAVRRPFCADWDPSCHSGERPATMAPQAHARAPPTCHPLAHRLLSRPSHSSQVEWLDEQGMEQLLREADVFVLPSRGEAWGRNLVDAMALGTPVIGCPGSGGPADFQGGPFMAPRLVADGRPVDSAV